MCWTARKTWISNGGIADVYTLFARTGEAPGAKGLSAFIVTPELKGFEVVERLETIAPHPLATLRFSGCRVPKENLIGPPGRRLQDCHVRARHLPLDGCSRCTRVRTARAGRGAFPRW